MHWHALWVCKALKRQAATESSTTSSSKLSKKHGKDNDAEIIASCGIAVAYTRADMFGPNKPRIYLKVKDPLTAQWRYF